MLWSVFGGVVILAWGAFNFFKPHLLWKWTEQWKSYRADETSDLYVNGAKVCGILFMLLGIVMMVLLLILE